VAHEIRSFTVAQQPAAVLAYLADFGHAAVWDPGTKSSERVDDGPVAVGARWQRTSTALGHSSEYRITELDERHVTFVAADDRVSATDVISVRAVELGCEITYESTVELHGVAKVGTPVVQYELDLLADEVVSGIRDALAALPE
jgi:carbon monoxide dehydrogenase subunit G